VTYTFIHLELFTLENKLSRKYLQLCTF